MKSSLPPFNLYFLHGASLHCAAQWLAPEFWLERHRFKRKE